MKVENNTPLAQSVNLNPDATQLQACSNTPKETNYSLEYNGKYVTLHRSCHALAAEFFKVLKTSQEIVEKHCPQDSNSIESLHQTVTIFSQHMIKREELLHDITRCHKASLGIQAKEQPKNIDS